MGGKRRVPGVLAQASSRSRVPSTLKDPCNGIGFPKQGDRVSSFLSVVARHTNESTLTISGNVPGVTGHGACAEATRVRLDGR